MFDSPINVYYVLYFKIINKMVIMGSIGVFYIKTVHTNREFSWERFMAPNTRVGAEWVIPMRFQ